MSEHSQEWIQVTGIAVIAVGALMAVTAAGSFGAEALLSIANHPSPNLVPSAPGALDSPVLRAARALQGAFGTCGVLLGIGFLRRISWSRPGLRLLSVILSCGVVVWLLVLPEALLHTMPPAIRVAFVTGAALFAIPTCGGLLWFYWFLGTSRVRAAFSRP